MSANFSTAKFITARDLFLAHHWSRYIAFRSGDFSKFNCGRICGKESDQLTLRVDLEERTITARKWAAISLREPKAAESVPPVTEVLSVGDWIGVDANGEVVLFAPCSKTGVSMLQAANSFETKAKAWAAFLARIRQFFAERNFVEVTTPTLARSPGTEPFLDPLKLVIETDQSSLERFLITSPEFSLKRALAAGLPRIFEIAKCFRNKEGGPHHRVEFHMLEWYRSFASLDEIADDTEQLLRCFAPKVSLQRVTVRELFRDYADCELHASTSRDELASAAARLAVRIDPSDDFADIFHRIFLEKIEPKIAELTSPLLISGYPPSMAALSRISRDGFADRFEIYWRGLELCNAFHELNDPSENLKRFEKDNLEKIRSGRMPVPIDDALMRALDLGVPPSGGIALGLERLFMAVHGISDIQNVRPFVGLD